MANPPKIDDILSCCDRDDPQYVTRIVDELLRQASEVEASDLHFQPTREGLQLKWRIDGVLHSLGLVPLSVSSNVIVRLKVLAKLLTYQSNLPQEGRIAQRDQSQEIRISTFPTVFGEKVVARLLVTGEQSLARVADLGLPADAVDSLRRALSQTSGMLLLVGPAGSGKTTTAYACLREILSQNTAQRNIASMEDPVEVVVDGVAQSEVATNVGFDLTSGLRSLMRQDPDIIFVGEIRDPATANIAYQAALTGQLVITTFHASDAGTAISRLADMGVPPYVLRSATNVIVAQQLVRRLCDCASEFCSADTSTGVDQNLGLPVERWRVPQGCQACQQTGYRGRQVIAEVLQLESSPVAMAIRPGVDAHMLQSLAESQGMQTLYRRALNLVGEGLTSPAEVVRVFGLPSD